MYDGARGVTVHGVQRYKGFKRCKGTRAQWMQSARGVRVQGHKGYKNVST